MSDLQYDAADAELLRALPEIRESYERELAWWEGDASAKHAIYGSVLNPLLRASLDRGDPAPLRRAFEFVERMAAASDERLVNIVAVTIVGALGDEAATLAKARPLMGPRTLELSLRAEAFLGRAPD